MEIPQRGSGAREEQEELRPSATLAVVVVMRVMVFYHLDGRGSVVSTQPISTQVIISTDSVLADCVPIRPVLD